MKVCVVGLGCIIFLFVAAVLISSFLAVIAPSHTAYDLYAISVLCSIFMWWLITGMLGWNWSGFNDI